jgi:hypothetical protein
MSEENEKFDPADYSVVVKLRGNPPKPWRWEITVPVGGGR